MQHKHTTQSGLTIVETIVVIALFTVLSLVISQTILSFYRTNAYTIAQANQVTHARHGVEQMVQDLREMAYADNGAFPLASRSSTSVSFYSDIDRDNSVEFVTYTLASTTLYKYIYNATGTPITYSTSTPDKAYTISKYVQNALEDQPVFTYYDVNGNEASISTKITDIRYIDVSAIVNINPIHDPGQFMLRSSATLRNLQNITI